MGEMAVAADVAVDVDVALVADADADAVKVECKMLVGMKMHGVRAKVMMENVNLK